MAFHRFTRALAPACMAIASFACIGAALALAQGGAPDALVKAVQAEGGFTLFTTTRTSSRRRP